MATRLIQTIIIGIMTSIILISCDPYGGYEYWIDNQTDSTLYLTYSEKYNDTIKIIEIKTYNNILLTKYETISGLYDRGNDFLKYWCDSIGIFKDTLLKKEITKDYRNRNSWSYDQENTHYKSGDNIYKLTITKKDL